MPPKCLFETAKSGVYANSFPTDDKTVITLYNSRYSTVRGELLKIPSSGTSTTYIDAFTKSKIAARQSEGFDYLEYVLGPKDVGAVIIQNHSP